jgi:sugar/nucleoside kinase (ribokinase family)
MWLIENRVFGEEKLADEARNSLLEALDGDGLTVVIGNSPSRAASWLKAPKAETKVGWEEIVRAVADDLKIVHTDIGSGHLLGLAEAICRREEGRAQLTDRLRKAFLGTVEGESTTLHQMIAEVKPRDIVTTNYDLLIEKCLQDAGLQWRASIRNAAVEPRKEGEILLHKMHGTVDPPGSFGKNNYVFRNSSHRGGSDSIVIAEEDYDECLTELKASDNSSPVLAALSHTCLVIGKSFYPEDLSFMYAFRAVRGLRGRAKPAYALCTGASHAEKLYLQNYGITALEIPMPTNAHPGHYYYAMIKALEKLLGKRCGEAHRLESGVLDIDKLVRRPVVLAVGLASMNVAGRTGYRGSVGANRGSGALAQEIRYNLPNPGRRNMRYEAESYVGGSAMTPLMVLTALDKEERYQNSMVTAVGRDIYGDEISEACKERGIDMDGVSISEKATWHSTVLVHDGVTSKNGEAASYPGQRIFLDRGYNDKVKLSTEAAEQLKAQLRQRSLRILYFDKFLAAPHPPDNCDIEAAGPLFEVRSVLDGVMRHDLNVIYDTGGGGSRREFVEEHFRRYINIFTSSFPFFARHILIESQECPVAAVGGLSKFASPDWHMTEFEDETRAIEEALQCLGLSESSERVDLQDMFPKLLERGRYWAGREDAKFRWLIVTLHHLGAMGINLHTGTMQYQPLPESQEEIQNTSGAGDTFRGALCYALLKVNEVGASCRDQDDLLRRCLEFAVRVAKVRCQEFHMLKALEWIAKEVEFAL